MNKHWESPEPEKRPSTAMEAWLRHRTAEYTRQLEETRKAIYYLRKGIENTRQLLIWGGIAAFLVIVVMDGVVWFFGGRQGGGGKALSTPPTTASVTVSPPAPTPSPPPSPTAAPSLRFDKQEVYQGAWNPISLTAEHLPAETIVLHADGGLLALHPSDVGERALAVLLGNGKATVYLKPEAEAVTIGYDLGGGTKRWQPQVKPLPISLPSGPIYLFATPPEPTEGEQYEGLAAEATITVSAEGAPAGLVVPVASTHPQLQVEPAWFPADQPINLTLRMTGPLPEGQNYAQAEVQIGGQRLPVVLVSHLEQKHSGAPGFTLWTAPKAGSGVTLTLLAGQSSLNRAWIAAGDPLSLVLLNVQFNPNTTTAKAFCRPAEPKDQLTITPEQQNESIPCLSGGRGGGPFKITEAAAFPIVGHVTLGSDEWWLVPLWCEADPDTGCKATGGGG